ncbi:MAG TPA: hypothetical protein VGX70_15895 [Gemmataceae bacterium]|nr:hypothetical protein [Gemmataceae bacterium]
MSRDDWYRRTSWSAADQGEFFDRLGRSRTSANKAQYLRIQATCLADADLNVAAVQLLNLLTRDFPERTELAQAHLQKAQCLIELREPQRAITEFRLSLQAQRDCPNVCTMCWLEFPWYLVRQNLTEYYEEALSVLEEFKSDTGLTYPIERYLYTATHALIAEARGDRDLARKFATQALQLEAQKFSGLRYHPNLGLVEEADSKIHRCLVALVGRSHESLQRTPK